MKRDAQELLTQWGIWTWQNTGMPRYVSPLLALMRDNVPGTHGRAAAITEEDAEEVSAILARLKQRYPSAYDAIAYLCRNNLTQEAAARGMGVSRIKFRELVMAGECYVQAVLDMRESACNGAREMRVCA